MTSLLLTAALLGASARVADAQSASSPIVRACGRGADAALASALRGTGDAEVEAAGVLPNPSLVVQHQQTLDGPEDRETTIGLSVPLGLGGRRFLRQDAAEARRAGAAASADGQVIEAAIDFREALAVAQRDALRVLLLEDQQRAIDALGGLLDGLARGGETSRHDRNRQRVQARLHQARVDEARAEAKASTAFIEAWAGQPVPLGDGGKHGFEATSLAQPEVPSPRVRALEAEARAAGLEADAARRAWVPDVDLFAGYRNADAGAGVGHGVSLSLTIPITVFDHGQGESGRAEADQRIARARLGKERALVDRTSRAIAARVGRLAATEPELIATERDAEEIVRETRELFARGEATLSELFDAYQAQADARWARLGRREAIVAAQIDLMRTRGSLLDPALERECLAAAAKGEK